MTGKHTGTKLADLIKKAIDDLELTTAEYQEILTQANIDGVVDPEEQRLLNELHHLIANGTVKRVRG